MNRKKNLVSVILLGLIAISFSSVDAQAFMQKGKHVKIKWKGECRSATVHNVRSDQIYVHFDGYSRKYDHWVSRHRLCSQTTHSVRTYFPSQDHQNDHYYNGQYVKVQYGRAWYAGKISQVKRSRYLVEYHRGGRTRYEWVAQNRLRRNFALSNEHHKYYPQYHVGQNVRVYRNGHWVPAKVRKSKNQTYLIRYSGAKSNPTEWVHNSRIRTL